MKYTFLFTILFISISSLFASGDCNEPTAKPYLKSKEIDSINGQINFDMYLVILDSIKITGIFNVTKPDFFSVNINSYPDTGVWHLPGDTIYYNITILHGTNWLPYFSKEIYIKNLVLSNGEYNYENFHGFIFFTPWNSIEIWDNYDYYTIGRVWKQENNFVDTTRIYIPRNNVPISNFNAEDSFSESWMAEYDLQDTFGLPFYVKMNPLNPDSIDYLSMHFGDDSIYHELDSIDISGPNDNFTGTVHGRLVTNFINDFGLTVVMPLTGVYIKLKEKDFYGSQDFGETHTDENGYFTIEYNKKQYFEGQDIELWLLFKSKNEEANLVVARPNLNFMDVTVLASSESFEHRKNNPQYAERDGGTLEFGDIFCNDHAMWVTHWAMNAYNHTSVSNKFTNHGKSLKFILNAGSSNYFSKVIRLLDFADDHERTVYHEFGHHIMYAMQGGGYMNLAGYPHKESGEHGTNCSRYMTHYWYHEEHSRMSFSEGFADAVSMILDGVYWEQDQEYGWQRSTDGEQDLNNGFERRGKYYDVDIYTYPKEINNGFKSEYYFGCAVYDMWDGPDKGLPDPSLYSLPGEPNYHPYTDRRFDNSLGFWTIPDNVSLSYLDLIKPLDIHDGSNKLHNIKEYIESLMFEVYSTDCEARRGIATSLYQNRVVLNISDVDTKQEDWNTMISSDEIYEFVTDHDEGKSLFCVTVSDEIHYKREHIENTPNKVFNLNNGLTTISNLQISDNLRLGYNYSSPTDRSTFNYNTAFSNRNLNMSTCGDVVWSINNNQFNLGDGNNTSTITFNSGSKIILDEMSNFIINDNSKLVIEQGAILEYHPGATIVLNGPNAILEIKGQIQLMDGATLTYTGGSNGKGFIRFFKNKNTNNINLITSPTFDGKVDLQSTTVGTKMLEIDGSEGLTVGNDVLEFKLNKAVVEMGEGSRLTLDVKNNIDFEWVKVIQLYSGYDHGGIRTRGCQNKFKHMVVEGGTYGFYHDNLTQNNTLNIEYAIIRNCDIGVYTYASGLDFHWGLINGYSIAGWKGVGLNKPSSIDGVTFNNDQNNSVNGIDVEGVSGLNTVNINQVKVIDNNSGLRSVNSRFNLKNCNYFLNNDLGAQMEAWSILDMSDNSYSTFDGNTQHFMSRFHGQMILKNGKNGFRQTGNSYVFFASLQPFAQSHSVSYIAPPPTALNFDARDNFFEPTMIQAPAIGNNFWIDERNTRVLNLLTNGTYPSNNPGVWTGVQTSTCGTYPVVIDSDEVDILGGTQKGRLGEFVVSKYSPLNSVLIPTGTFSGNPLVTTCKSLLDSLYTSANPNYNYITTNLSDLVRYRYSNASSLMKDLLYDIQSHLLVSYSKGVSMEKIFISPDSIGQTTTKLLSTIDTLIHRASIDSLPWAPHHFILTGTKAEIYRLAQHRSDAISVLEDAQIEFVDSTEQVFLEKWICINEAEIAYLDSSVSLDSMLIEYPCYYDWTPPAHPSRNTGISSYNKNAQNQNELTLYPNPANNELMISSTNQKIQEIRIYDSKGMLQMQYSVSEDSNSIKINTEQMPSGQYIIQVVTQNSTLQSRFLIVR